MPLPALCREAATTPAHVPSVEATATSLRREGAGAPPRAGRSAKVKRSFNQRQELWVRQPTRPRGQCAKDSRPFSLLTARLDSLCFVNCQRPHGRLHIISKGNTRLSLRNGLKVNLWEDASGTAHTGPEGMHPPPSNQHLLRRQPAPQMPPLHPLRDQVVPAGGPA